MRAIRRPHGTGVRRLEELEEPTDGKWDPENHPSILGEQEDAETVADVGSRCWQQMLAADVP